MTRWSQGAQSPCIYGRLNCLISTQFIFWNDDINASLPPVLLLRFNLDNCLDQGSLIRVHSSDETWRISERIQFSSMAELVLPGWLTHSDSRSYNHIQVKLNYTLLHQMSFHSDSLGIQFYYNKSSSANSFKDCHHFRRINSVPHKQPHCIILVFNKTCACASIRMRRK